MQCSRSPRSQVLPGTSRRTFPYRATAPGNPAALSPLLPIILHGPSGRIPVYGLVDSGASDTLIPHDLMAYLGIVEANCTVEPCETANGLTDQYIWPAGLEVEIQQLARKVAVKAAFSKGLPAQLVLLGRRDFFAQFRVEVDERAQTFSLDPYDP